MPLHSIMVVDDNVDMLTVYGRVLTAEGFEVFTAATGSECLKQIETVCPDIFLLDVMLPDWNGIDLVREIKGRTECANSFIVLLSGLMTDSDCKVRGLDAGALDYLARPIPNKELVAKVKSLVKVMEFQESLVNISKKFEALSITDGLTGIANRRCFDEVIAQEHSRHARSEGKLSLIMLDIDLFKSFNDHYGHVCGDDCLRRIAKVIDESTARPGDLVARYGGEEFACILPETDQRGALLIAEKIRQAILDLAIPHAWSNIAECVSASLGVVTSHCGSDSSVTEIVHRADELLYKAKSLGRNRVECNELMHTPEQIHTHLVQLVWKDSFSSRNDLIDSQHQLLFHDTNELLEAIILARPKDELNSIVNRLLSDAAQHFNDEECVLGEIGFPGSAKHAAEHARLLVDGRKLARKFTADALNVGDIFQFMVHELVMQHMLGADRDFFPYTCTAPQRGDT